MGNKNQSDRNIGHFIDNVWASWPQTKNCFAINFLGNIIHQAKTF